MLVPGSSQPKYSKSKKRMPPSPTRSALWIPKSDGMRLRRSSGRSASNSILSTASLFRAACSLSAMAGRSASSRKLLKPGKSSRTSAKRASRAWMLARIRRPERQASAASPISLRARASAARSSANWNAANSSTSALETLSIAVPSIQENRLTRACGSTATNRGVRPSWARATKANARASLPCRSRLSSGGYCLSANGPALVSTRHTRLLPPLRTGSMSRTGTRSSRSAVCRIAAMFSEDCITNIVPARDGLEGPKLVGSEENLAAGRRHVGMAENVDQIVDEHVAFERRDTTDLLVARAGKEHVLRAQAKALPVEEFPGRHPSQGAFAQIGTLIVVMRKLGLVADDIHRVFAGAAAFEKFRNALEKLGAIDVSAIDQSLQLFPSMETIGPGIEQPGL